MRPAPRIFVRLTHDRKGATAVEYGLVVALIAIAALGGLMGLGGGVGNTYAMIENKYRTAAGQ